MYNEIKIKYTYLLVFNFNNWNSYFSADTLKCRYLLSLFLSMWNLSTLNQGQKTIRTNECFLFSGNMYYERSTPTGGEDDNIDVRW